MARSYLQPDRGRLCISIHKAWEVEELVRIVDGGGGGGGQGREVLDLNLDAVRRIDVLHDEEDDDDEEVQETTTASSSLEGLKPSGVVDFDKAVSLITSILTMKANASDSNGLEAFTWHGTALSGYSGSNSVDDGPTRPSVFWSALARTAPTLAVLDLDWYPHELHRLEKSSDGGSRSGFPTSLPKLQALRLNLSGAHGNDAGVIDRLLCAGMPDLRSLKLVLPTCDLENCRVQGLSYGWTFPELTFLSLSVFYSESSASSILEFLAGHPKIETLEFNVEGEESLLPPSTTNTTTNSGLFDNLFPNLRALELGSSYAWSNGTYDFLLNPTPPAPARAITHLNLGQCPYPRYADIPNLRSTLRSLSLSLDLNKLRSSSSSSSAEEEDPHPQIPAVKDLLAHLPDLEDLRFQFNSANSMYRDASTGKWFSEKPVNLAGDLDHVLQLLPCGEDGYALTTLRLSDYADEAQQQEEGEKGEGRREELATRLSSLGSGVPAKLRWLCWDLVGAVKESRRVFEVQRNDDEGGGGGGGGKGKVTRVEEVEDPEGKVPDAFGWGKEPFSSGRS